MSGRDKLFHCLKWLLSVAITKVNDGNVSFGGGQNDGLFPSQIGRDQYRRGVNVTTTRGVLSPRPGFIFKDVDIRTSGKVGKQTYRNIFRRGKFQGAVSYDADDGQFIVAVISGIIFRINPRLLVADVIELPDGDRMNQYTRRIPWAHAGRFLVFFDYPNLPVIVENREARRSNTERTVTAGFPAVQVPQPEVPTSVLGAYVNNRLWVANAGQEFLASDPVGGASADAPITFEQTFAPGSPFLGQSFSLGSQSGNRPITAMGFLQVADTSTGVGPLIIATKNSVYVYRADLPRDQWTQSAFGRLMLYNAGICGPRAFTNLNSDLIMLGGDNQVRSLFIGVRDQERWANTPISREVSPWLQEFENKQIMDIAFVEAYKNRVFVGVAPFSIAALTTDQRDVYDYAHGGMIVLELDNISALGANANPVWCGLWTGIYPMEMIVLEDGPYIFSKDEGGINRLYFLDESKTYDEFNGKKKDITCRIYTRAYDFENRFLDKEVGIADYGFSNIAGNFKLKVEYRGSNLERYALWKDFSYKAKTETCFGAGEGCDVDIPILMEQSFRELNFGDPIQTDCDDLTQDEGKILRQVELRLTLSAANWVLQGIRLRFDLLEDLDHRDTSFVCEDKEAEVIGECGLSDWQIYTTGDSESIWQ